VSTATWGLGYFAFQIFFLVGLKWLKKDFGPAQMPIPFLFSIFAVLLGFYFIYILTFILKERCLACYGVHTINGLLLIMNVYYLVRTGDALHRKYLKSYFLNAQTAAITLISLLLATNIVSGANLLETKYHLQEERKKLSENLQYYSYLHNQSKAHEFTIAPTDKVIGEKAIALHQILLVYKDGCSHCERAKTKLSLSVRKHHLAVYLVMKNIDSLSKAQLKQFGITRVPVVFIDGKRADGWEMPGFMDAYFEDCGC
jgi:glutaredoxin